MALGRREQDRQREMWIAAQDVAAAPGYLFYRKPNELLVIAPVYRQTHWATAMQ